MELSADRQVLRREVEAALAGATLQGLPGIRDVAVLHGNGNSIAIVELAATSDSAVQLLAAATRELCGGVTALRIDGVLFFYPYHHTGRRMIFFDRDGTWEAMCGNGLRCLTRYGVDTGALDTEDTVITDDGPRAVRVTDDGQVEVALGEPRELRQVRPDWWFVYNGVPHLVLFVERVGDIDVRTEGARLRYDTALCELLQHPEGVHIDFAEVAGAELVVRTYEVGVEDETLCCGTGVAAAGFLGWRTGRTQIPVTVRTAGGAVHVAMAGKQLTIRGEVTYLLPSVYGGALLGPTSPGGAP